MATQAQLNAQRKYDKAHTQQISLKFNRTSDADILAKFADVDNVQGYLKELVRQDLRGRGRVLSADALRYMLRPLAKRYSLKSIYLFGSYARGEARADSDVDLMIETSKKLSAEDYFSLEEQMEAVLGKEVDLVMGTAARKNKTRAGQRFLQHFERDKVLLYEKME